MSRTFYYEFGEFHLDPERRILLLKGERVSITRKPFDMLVALIENRSTVLTKEDLINAVWAGLSATDNTFNVTLAAARKALGDSASRREYIVTQSDGYRFIGEIKKVSLEPNQLSSAVLLASATPQTENPAKKIALPFGGHRLQIHFFCLMYGLLNGGMLIAEVVYEFDKYRKLIFVLAPLVFLLTYITSLIALKIAWRDALKERNKGLGISIGVFIGAGILLYGLAFLFLPSHAITQQTTPAATAQAAYLKDLFYHLILITLFFIFPFNLVLKLQRELDAGRKSFVFAALTNHQSSWMPQGAIYIKPWALGIVLIVFMSLSYNAQHSLTNSLMMSPYTNAFTQLLWLRLIVFYGLGIECLAWYYLALNELKRESSHSDSQTLQSSVSLSE